MHKIAFVVPTKDRPDDLRKLLASISAQTRKPDQLIIVDGSDPDIRHVVEAFAQLNLSYVRVFPPSLSQQRNAGMKQLRPEITLAGYLDDDIVLEPAAIESMVKFWENTSVDLGGAAFNITNVTRPRWQRVKQLFGIDSRVPGKVLASGFPTTLGSPSSDIDADWLNGGATVWRREVIEKFGYDEWFLGTGFLEDVDFSFSVRQFYRLALVAGARVAHYSRPARLENEHLLGKWQVVNRMYLVRKHEARGLSVLAAWIASIALLVLNTGNAILRADRRYFLRARGNLAGIGAELAGNRERVGGHLK